MSESLTRQAVKSISRICHATLKPEGFTQRRSHLLRRSHDLYHGVHFQASRWGSNDFGKFTVNLHVTSLSLYRYWTGCSLPTEPATVPWPVHQRLGYVCPEKLDLWWDVTPDTDVEHLAADVTDKLRDHALPFFARFSASSCLLDAIEQNAPIPGTTGWQLLLLHAMLLQEANRSSEAGDVIRDTLIKVGSTPFRGAAIAVAERLGLPT